jgi:hypothetical protein
MQTHLVAHEDMIKTHPTVWLGSTLALLIGMYQPVSLVQLDGARAAAATSIWRSFRSDTAGFTILMPGEPQRSQESNTISYTVRRPRESVTYTVSYADFPSNVQMDPTKGQDVLLGVKEGMVETGARLMAQQTITLSSQFPGTDLRFVMPDQRLVRLRAYVVGQRLYLVMVATDNEKNLMKSIEGFFNSFQVSYFSDL